jgi:hypothetical protein
MFVETTRSPFAHEVIDRLQGVYVIEAEIRGSSAEQRLTARRIRTAPLMEALKARLTSMVGQLFSQSTLTGAINYAVNHWDGLTLFLNDGRVEVDTNKVERSMRPIAMGRRNSLFSGSEGGAESCAILALLVNTAKLHELDPQAYLADVLEPSSPRVPRAINCTSSWPGTGRPPANAPHGPPHEPASPSGIVIGGGHHHAARRTRSMASGARRAASSRHQHPDAGRLRCRDRGRAGIDQRVRPDLSAARRRRRCIQPRRHPGVRGDLRRRAAPQRHQQHPLDRPASVRADAPAQAEWRRRRASLVPGVRAAMRPRILAWAPLLDTSNINHGLLLPILLHCLDDQGRPPLGPARKGRETKEFLRNAHTDIPAVVEAMRQYWMRTRYARAR